jgi:Putative undecaprenyl diphosphate synthase
MFCQVAVCELLHVSCTQQSCAGDSGLNAIPTLEPRQASAATQMAEVITWCIEAGVKHISVYAFSIDNFRRSPDEVSTLMKLACEKYHEMTEVRPRRKRHCSM